MSPEPGLVYKAQFGILGLTSIRAIAVDIFVVAAGLISRCWKPPFVSMGNCFQCKRVTSFQKLGVNKTRRR
jgi:hypothetical protein